MKGSIFPSALGMEIARASGFSALARQFRPSTGCFLTFHRVARPEDWPDLPNREFHIDAGFLGRLLDHLRRTGVAVVTMDEAVERMRAGPKGGRYANFSIDDIYRDTFDLAVPVFRQHGVPVTLFVTTGIPDGTLPLWAASLESVILERAQVTLLDGAAANTGSPAEKRALFQRLSAAWENDRPAEHFERFCALNGASVAELRARHAVTWDMLEALRHDPCVEVGGHTVSHPRLASLPDEDARREIADCRCRLQARLGLPIRHFAYPFGRRGDCGPREFAFAREAGYTTALTTRKGVATSADLGLPHALPRNTLNGAHRRLSQMDMHLSGLGGMLASMMGAT